MSAWLQALNARAGRALSVHIVPTLPAIALGWFLARLYGETFLISEEIQAVVLGTLLGLVVAAALWPAVRDRIPRSAFVLWLYVCWPWADWNIAAFCASVAVLAACAPHVRAAWTRWRTPRVAHFVFLLSIFCASLALYTLTLAPDVLPADAGEFQRVAAELGVAHPPGYPLYTLLAFAFTRLPFNTPAWSVNWFSAVTAALTLALVAQATLTLTGSRWGALVAAITLATATSFWATATQASIRPLTALFTAACVAALVAYRPERPRVLIAFALALGLGLGHHVSLAFAGVFLALGLLVRDPALVLPSRRWLAPAGVFLATLTVFAYLPWRAEALRDFNAFLDHALARGFEGDMGYFITRAPELFWERLALLPGLLTFAFHPLSVLAAGAGALVLAVRNPRLGLPLCAAFAAHAFVTLTYRAPQTVEYLLPAYVLLALGAGVAASTAARHGHAWLAALVLCLPFVHGVELWPSMALLARDMDTRTTVQPVLEKAPPGALILANWHWATPLLYLQAVERLRPDVQIEYVYPRGEPLADSWTHTITAAGPTRPVLVWQAYDAEYAAAGITLEPFGRDAWQVAPESTPWYQARFGLPSDFSALAAGTADFDGQVRVLGYTLAEPTATDNTYVLTLAWTTLVPVTRDYHSFVHVLRPAIRLGPAGFPESGPVPVAQQDLTLATASTTPGTIRLTRYRLARPLTVANQPYTLVFGLYDTPDSGGFARLHLPDGADAYTLMNLPSVPAGGFPLPTQHPLEWHYQNGPTLVGYDWEPATSQLYLHWRGPVPPNTAIDLFGYKYYDVAGQKYRSPFHTMLTPLPVLTEAAPFTTVHSVEPTDLDLAVWRGSTVLLKHWIWGLPVPWELRPIAFDPAHRYVPLGGGLILLDGEFSAEGCTRAEITWGAVRPLVRDAIVSVQADGDWYAQADGVPALGAVPTLKWWGGARVVDRHVLAPPVDARGSATAQVFVYDAFTREPAALLDPQWAQQGAGVPLGACTR